jgi:molecular chaperone IbpA
MRSLTHRSPGASGPGRGRRRRPVLLVTHVALQEDVEMRTNDFSPYYRSSIGFDRMLDLLGAPERPGFDDAWPPYDIERLDEDRYSITMAIAGFGQDDITIMAEPNALLVEGCKSDNENGRNFLHRGISQRAFRRKFDLADFVKVTGASLEHGLLRVELEREIPEAMKPRRIEIGTSQARVTNETRQGDAKIENAA